MSWTPVTVTVTAFYMPSAFLQLPPWPLLPAAGASAALCRRERWEAGPRAAAGWLTAVRGQGRDTLQSQEGRSGGAVAEGRREKALQGCRRGKRRGKEAAPLGSRKRSEAKQRKPCFWKLNIDWPCDPAVPGRASRQSSNSKGFVLPCVHNSTVSVAKTWRQPSCPLTEE